MVWGGSAGERVGWRIRPCGWGGQPPPLRIGKEANEKTNMRENVKRKKETERNVRLAGAEAPVAPRGGPQGSVEGIVTYEGPIR